MLVGLKEYEAVSLENGNLLVKLGYGQFVYRNGAGHVTLQGNRECVIHSEGKLFRCESLGKQCIGYYNMEDPTCTVCMSVEEYTSKIQKYEEDYRDPDTEEICYPSLVVEFECRKELESLNKLQAKYEDLGTKETEVVFTVIGSMEDTGSPFIVTPISVGAVRHQGCSGFYKVMSSDIAKNEYLKLVKELGDKFEFECPYHGNIKYAKVDGKYIFSEAYPFGEKHVRSTSSLTEAKRIEQDVRSQVKVKLLDKVAPVAVPSVMLGGLIHTIEDLAKRIKEIDAKQKSLTVKDSATSACKKLLDTLKEQLAKEHGV